MKVMEGINVMMRIETEELDQAVIVHIFGELSMNDIEKFENAFKELLNSKPVVIGLDLKNVPYVDSFGISRMVKISRAVIELGIDFVLINMNENVLQVFRMTTFDKIFRILTRKEFNNIYSHADGLGEFSATEQVEKSVNP